MDALRDFLARLLDREEWDSSLSLEALEAAMDPLAWLMVGFVMGTIGLALLFRLRPPAASREAMGAEAMPGSLLERLRQNPAYLTPAAILQRLGSELVLELLEHWDQVEDDQMSSRWPPVREELLRLLSAQHAFGPIRALMAYYRCTDQSEPASLRIRRTALIHKLGQRRTLPSLENQPPAQLMVFTDGQEPVGELGFQGRIHWLRPEHRPQMSDGPMVELDPISFHSLEAATIKVRIYRSLLVGSGFRLHFTRIGQDWIITKEELEWAR